MKDTAFIVTHGEYSDYHILGVFDSRDLAEAFIAIFGGEVEEWKINPALLELKAGMRPFFVRMKRDGTVDLVNIRMDPDNVAAAYTGGVVNMFGNLQASMWALSEEHAIKIANERRIFLIATNQWPDKVQ